MPRLKLREIRKRKPKPYNLNSLIGVHFSETNSSGSLISAFPREAWFNFEQSYEERSEGSTPTLYRIFHAMDLTGNAGTIITPNTATSALCLNTLESNYNPHYGLAYGQDAINANHAPYGAKLISDMYKTYRVTSCYFKFRFRMDTQVFLGKSSTEAGQKVVLRGGIILTKKPHELVNHTALREAILANKIRTRRWVITNNSINIPELVIDGDVNIIKQFDQDDQSVDQKDTTTFAALLGNGSTTITSPATALYVVPFFMIDEPMVSFQGVSPDNAVALLTDIYVKKTTLMSGPKEKPSEAGTGDPT